jgi:hypothetical protein
VNEEPRRGPQQSAVPVPPYPPALPPTSSGAWPPGPVGDAQPGSFGEVPGAEQPLVYIGDIMVSQLWVVTPTGPHRLKGVTFSAADFSLTQRKIPAWAIVLTIILIWFFLLSLLFLLAKEDYTTGTVQVTVRGVDVMYVTHIPVRSHAAVIDIQQRVAYANTLAFNAPA